MEKDKLQTDLSALFMPRQPSMTAEEAVRILFISNAIKSHRYLEEFFANPFFFLDGLINTYLFISKGMNDVSSRKHFSNNIV